MKTDRDTLILYETSVPFMGYSIIHFNNYFIYFFKTLDILREIFKARNWEILTSSNSMDIISNNMINYY